MIIKNCNVLYFNPDGSCVCNDLTLEYPVLCKERTGCLLKQIVKECRDETELPLEMRGDLAERISSLFEIEEEK